MKKSPFSFSLLFPTTSIVLMIFFVVFIIFSLRPSSPTPNLQDQIHVTQGTVSRATVMIVGKEGITGAGVIIDEKGTILTSKHLVQMGERYGIRFADKEIEWARPVSLHPTLDLALLTLETHKKRSFVPVIASQVFLRPGDLVVASGTLPESQSFVSHLGMLSAINQSLHVGDKTFTGLLLTDIPLQAGYSGGPLVNLRSELIGIDTAYETGGHVGWSTPVDAYFLREWRKDLR